MKNYFISQYGAICDIDFSPIFKELISKGDNWYGKKVNKKVSLQCEGETEKWYLDWLKDNINQCSRSRYKVVMDCK